MQPEVKPALTMRLFKKRLKWNSDVYVYLCNLLPFFFPPRLSTKSTLNGDESREASCESKHRHKGDDKFCPVIEISVGFGRRIIIDFNEQSAECLNVKASMMMMKARKSHQHQRIWPVQLTIQLYCSPL